jgi:hypothetical protein
MKKIIIIFAVLSNVPTFASTKAVLTTDQALEEMSKATDTKASNEILPLTDNATIADFEEVKLVPTASNIQVKGDVVTDTIVPIEVAKADTAAEIIPQQTSIPTEAINHTSVDTQKIRSLLQESTPRFQLCYQNELDSVVIPENFKGSINLHFTIAPTGKIQNADISSSTFHSEKVYSCIKKELGEIRFPENGKKVNVNQPMNLSPVRK